jgi:hypothetical protein
MYCVQFVLAFAVVSQSGLLVAAAAEAKADASKIRTVTIEQTIKTPCFVCMRFLHCNESYPNESKTIQTAQAGLQTGPTGWFGQKPTTIREAVQLLC